MTSRRQLRGLVAKDGAHPFTLGPLSVAEAEQFLVHRLGAGRIAAERPAVAEIITRCARLPLALGVVAARVSTNPALSLTDVAADLARDGDEPSMMFTDPEGELDVHTVFSWSGQALRPAAAALFGMLGEHRGPELSVAAVASLAALPPRRARTLLDELAGVHLLEERSPGRYACHELLSGYARRLARGEPDAVRHAARHRLLDHYLHGTRRAVATLFPHHNGIPVAAPRTGVVDAEVDSQQQARTWLRTEMPVLFSIVTQADDLGFAGYPWRIAAELELFLDSQGRRSDQVTVQRAALASAHRDGDLLGIAHTSRALGFAHGRAGNQRAAHQHLSQALRLCTEIGDHDMLGDTRRNMAFLATTRGEYRRGLAHYEHALAAYRSTANRAGEATVLNEIGWTLIMLGAHSDALDYCRRSVTLHVATGNRTGEAAARDNLGHACHHLGRYDRAIDHFQDARQIYQDISDPYLEADTLHHIGRAAAASGDRDTARHAWDDALDILNELAPADSATVCNGSTT